MEPVRQAILRTLCFHAAWRYAPTLPEWEVVFGIWALGAFLITVLYKITLSVRAGANHGARQWQHS